MLSVLAWIVFVPALIWNIAIFILILSDLRSTKEKINWTNPLILFEVVFSVAIFFISGAYLFGWF